MSDILEALENFRIAKETEKENRAVGEEDLAFYLGGEGQWDANVLSDRVAEGRPALTCNLIPQFVHQVIGDQRQSGLGIKVRPANSTPDGIGKARLFQGLIRHIEQVSNSNQAYDTGFMCSLVNGFGYWRVDTEYVEDDMFEQEIYIRRIQNPFSVYFDPRFTHYDSSDKKFAFVLKRISRKQFDKDFPGAAPSDFISEADNSVGNTSVQSNDLTIAEHWYLKPTKAWLYLLSDGAVRRREKRADAALYEALAKNRMMVLQEKAVDTHVVMQEWISGTEVLDGPNLWPGKFIPIIPCWGEEIYIKGKRYLKSLIHDAKDPQRSYNYFRTSIAERIGLAPKAPFMVAAEQIEGHEHQWENANKKYYPYLKYNPVSGVNLPSRVQPPAMSSAEFQEAQNAKMDIMGTMGIYEAGLGKQSNERSGRAIFARQRESDNSTFHHKDAFGKALQFTGRVLLDLIPKIYDSQREVRILGDDDKPQFHHVNVLVNGEYVNDLSEGNFESYVDVGPDFVTQRAEAVESMIQLLQTAPSLAPVVLDLVVANMDFEGADKIAERLKQAVEAQQAQQQQASHQEAITQAHGMSMDEAHANAALARNNGSTQ